MATIRQFEDIESWKSARALSKAIYAVTRKEAFAKDFALKNQMRRAAVSVMANIAEGFDRGGDSEFRQFLSIAKGSTSEVQSHLYAAMDAEMLTQEEFDSIYNLARDTNFLIGGFMRYLNESELKGRKYRE